MAISWVTRWKYEMAAAPTKPGIWRLKDGGYFVRAQFGSRVLKDASLPEAIATRAELSTPPPIAPRRKPLFSVFAVQLLEEKLTRNEIESAATRDNWNGALKDYLIPAFGLMPLDQIQHVDISDWTATVAGWIKNGKPSLKDSAKDVSLAPSTANGWLRILRTILNEAVVRFDLGRNPYDGIKPFKEPRAYTAEEPNSLSPDQVRLWLRLAAEKYPQHYAMMVLGFVTGRRPGELRALRRNVDVLWHKNQVLIRRSHSRKQEVMDRTKTGRDLVLHLPDEIMATLKEHVATLPAGPMRDSDLLFPSTTGNIRSRSGLDKPFAALLKEIGVGHTVTPRAMRRSFQDLAREAQVQGLVTRSISGHRTETMQDHYSTVMAHEQRVAVDKIMGLVR